MEFRGKRNFRPGKRPRFTDATVRHENEAGTPQEKVVTAFLILRDCFCPQRDRLGKIPAPVDGFPLR
jgi:hypothetical protein